MTLPLTQATVTGAATSRPEQSRRARQMAAAAVVILLLALAAAAYFVLRGPARAQIDPASNLPPIATAPPPSPDSSSVKQPDAQTDKQQVSEDKKKAADARRQAEQDAAAIEAQKKAAELKEKADKQDKSPQQPAPAVTIPQPAVPAPPPAADTVPPPAGAGGAGCVVVTVLDADGEPATAVNVGLMDESDGSRSGGRTGPKGHWQLCGLTPGHSVRVAAMGPLGGLLNSQTVVVASPRTFVTIRLQRKSDEAPQRMPDRKRPFRRRP
jgi:hypothetical protein